MLFPAMLFPFILLVMPPEELPLAAGRFEEASSGGTEEFAKLVAKLVMES